MNYMAWNDAIGARFFNPDRSGARVFLYVTTEVIIEIGASHNADLEDFIAAAKTGPPWNTRPGREICRQALQAFADWRTRDLDYPPYLVYLALFVLADTIEVDGFARHAYYPRLRSLLGEQPETGTYPLFPRMYSLWDDLAVWSIQDRQGDLGLFDADIVGGWINVGFPRAQTLLTDEERGNMPFLFADNGLDPNSPPSDREIAYLFADDPHRYLRPQTKRLLRSTESSIRNALVEVLLDELEHWDGSVSARPHEGERDHSSLGNLRLAMTLDRTAREARLSLRCRSNREYPDEGLQLTNDTMEESLFCYEDWQGWSTPLSISESQMNLFDPSQLDWKNGFYLVDREHSWKTTFSQRSVRVMVNARQFGFDGFVEDSQIPKGKPFYLLAHDDNVETLHSWGRESCEGFSEVSLGSGLPSRWRLYSVELAHSDDVIRDELPFLSFPTLLRIQFRGGLKVKGSQYFTFALPLVEVTGVIEAVSVFCNDHRLDIDRETGLYKIPNALCARRLIIEVRKDGECVRRRSLYSIETVAWRDTIPTAHIDKFGLQAEEEATEKCVGPVVESFIPPDFNPEVFLPPSTGHRVYFLGRNPGEVVECPNETIPDNWQPVWAVIMQRRGRGIAVYCGTNPTNESPGTADCGDRRRYRLWIEILWYRRKRITSPSHPALNALWRRYKEVANRVR